MAREDLHFRLRIPELLKAKIETAAAKNRRSMTAEIVERLERSVVSGPLPGDLSVNDLSDLLFAVDQVHQAVKSLIGDEQRNEEFRRARLFEGMSALLQTTQKFTRAVWAAEYDASAELQSEFLSRDNYTAYMQHYGAPKAFGVEWRKAAVAAAMESIRSSASANGTPPPDAPEPKPQ